jgi:aspartate 1-decarboxylase
VGDRIIICSYARLSEEEADKFEPNLVYLDEENNVTEVRNRIPVQKPRLVSTH